ncbi:PIN domain nuclease [Pueribacillus theae]|uniref:PIN domain nuclease n=1 Tax=Pueribacillus theae TaxID=2171751 RepID=A0A2U1JSY7_9BACI|nr:PIN domain-containing protein [Pueribacillus theae]PWA07928.1 PIN domain nuclease [Pueribacillus theae]
MPDHFWADTNVIIRHITGEPQKQAEEVQEIMRHVDEGTFILHINPMVIAECCYVLEAIYEFNKKDISKALKFFLASEGIEMEEKKETEDALIVYGQKNVDFEDAYLAETARCSSITAIMTFDSKHFKRLNCEYYTPKQLIEVND